MLLKRVGSGWAFPPLPPSLQPPLAWEEGRGVSLRQSKRDCRSTQRASPVWPELGGCRLASASHWREKTVAAVAPAREQSEDTGLERGWDRDMGVPGAIG